ncbi:double-strand break repair helicase AddA [Methylobacterium sp. 4-46]|uniref:double-strand break repair helicase AddA n=1 Tax=unclassified Methylobacterium TaxID=2615210 RepID=UPI000152D235|nr:MULTISPECIES: double-strand break repair helicase AddA [Methylobacterium]ACA15052.1 double-strand break repair helicase AddA [Methylobacterium sp. 4-46]WFT80790.1 double-strand break repair helicase AddA [Methylobacterium nodulans]
MGIEGFVVDAVTQTAQRRAADPRASAWVSANAGAGKTKVLTDRVVRLLLHGAPPAKILCLTFTKAAAANMAIRVFERLGRWVTLPEEALRAELTALEGERPDPATLRRARRLFARAVETPGGLKIETLHALCERLLHLVPFEANVPARFVVLDEAQTREAVDRTIDNVLADAVDGTRPDLAQALARVAPEAAGEALRRAIGEAVRARAVLLHPQGLPARLERLREALGLAPDEAVGTIEARMREGAPADWAGLAAQLRTGKATDEKRADALARAAAAEEPQDLPLYLAAFFKDEGEGDPYAPASLGTKAVPEAVRRLLLDEQARLGRLRERLKAARAQERTAALFTLAAEIHRRVEAQKARLGALDFDDLIHKTLDLLTRVDSAWVLYKLDRGVDHVLIDEAQDTNPEQWEILRRITEDFCAGEGARRGPLPRTRFAVGDPKQSIYSFQGAAPEEFETTRQAWRRAARGAGLAFEDVGLTLSFRSAKGVLRGVDATFALAEHYRGLSFGDGAIGTVHETVRVGAPGQVELWPTEEPCEEPEPDAWVQPVDAVEAGAPALVVARRVARAVRHWTREGDEHGRIWRPGEILILVRKRSAAFEGVIRALKAEDVPVAGQDRLDIAAHIAVMDLVAAGRAALLPDDDLTLACALKTPLVGLTDDDLVRLAARRAPEESLAAALARHAGAGDPAALRGAAALATWRRLAQESGPFGFYADLLGPLGGRARLVARLGGEAGDAIDVFLTAAAQAEQGADAPSLTGFLSRYAPSGGRDAGGHTVKRDLESARDEVRVMTVHGAKGLEAGLLVLIDGCEPLGRNDPPLLPVPVRGAGGVADGTVPVWSPSKGHDCPAGAAAREALHERARQEHNRLLYVAMTRAKDRLVIAPYRGRDRETPESWCEMVRRGLVAAFGGVERAEMPYGPAETWRHGAALPAAPATAVPPAPPGERPDWLFRPVAPEAEPLPPLRPSGLGAADEPRRSQPRSGDPAARRRGVLIHALLEHLPALAPERRAAAARAFVAARAPGLPAAEREALATSVLRLLADPDLSVLFGPLARAEVALAGTVSLGGVEWPVHGRIDRLAVTEEAVWLCDFKTGRPPAEGAPVPGGMAAQVALYAALLARIHPDRAVIPLLVWTAGPVIRRLSGAECAAALAALRPA